MDPEAGGREAGDVGDVFNSADVGGATLGVAVDWIMLCGRDELVGDEERMVLAGGVKS